jgi:NAD(P)-dependent dehydrogenase (short-subunit alcohol dehydrogenase family)
MAAQGGGTILATGSGAADHPTPGAPSLAVQKAALRILTRGFAAELAPSGVHCATVTVTGTLGTPGFAVGDIAGVYADLVAETSGPPETWRTVVEFTGAG